MKNDLETLRLKINEFISTHPCRWGIVIANLATGERLEINPQEVFPSASMIKLPILYEIMRQAANGSLSLEEMLIVNQKIRVGGAGILPELRPDIPMTIRELATLMIILSDNTATNLLIDRLGMEAVNRTITALHLPNTILQRRMMDFVAAETGRENYTSAADMARMLEIIYASEGLPPAYGEQMMDILKRQQVQDKLPFYLPEETVLAHKTGTLPGVEHDAGILFVPGGPYLLSVMTGGLKENYLGLQWVACIGKIVYGHVTGCSE